MIQMITYSKNDRQCFRINWGKRNKDLTAKSSRNEYHCSVDYLVATVIHAGLTTHIRDGFDSIKNNVLPVKLLCCKKCQTMTNYLLTQVDGNEGSA